MLKLKENFNFVFVFLLRMFFRKKEIFMVYLKSGGCWVKYFYWLLYLICIVDYEVEVFIIFLEMMKLRFKVV